MALVHFCHLICLVGKLLLLYHFIPFLFYLIVLHVEMHYCEAVT